MSTQDLSHYIPRRLDDSGKFLFWDVDVAVVALLGMIIGLATEYRILGVILGVLMAFGYKKLKTGKHPGIAAHLMYWFIGNPVSKELPPSYIREFNG